MSQEDKPIAAQVPIHDLSYGDLKWCYEKSLADEKNLQAKITEQAELISELEARETILVHSNSSLNIQNKALEAEAADRESFIKTLADTCTEAERIAIERAGRIDVLESECRKLRDALSETEAFCKRKDITIERQSKVIGLCKEAMTWDVGGEPLPTLEVEALAAIAELEKGVV